MNYHIVSIFPDSLDSYISESIIGRAQKSKLINILKYSLRDFTLDKHKRVDGPVYGGGPGMVLWVDPIVNANKKVIKFLQRKSQKKHKSKSKVLIVNFNIGGDKFDTNFAKSCINDYLYTDIVFICGRYEGVDDRVNQVLESLYKFYKVDTDIINLSVGDYVLTGGELPALILIDSISRQILGVLHDKSSLEEDRISSRKVFARPEIYKAIFKEKKLNKDGLVCRKLNPKTNREEIVYKQKEIIATVPEVLLSGDHKKIDLWRNHNS